MSATTQTETCAHEHTRQVDEYDVECIDCGMVSA